MEKGKKESPRSPSEGRDAKGRFKAGIRNNPAGEYKPGVRNNPAGEIKPGEHLSPATEFKPGIRNNPAGEFKPGEHRGLTTEFKPGDPNNPHGRRKLSPEERNTLEKIRGLAPLVVEQMEQILRDEETPLILRIKIFEIVLDRTYGRVPAKVDITSSQDAVEAAQARLDAIFARGLMTGDEPEKEATPAIVVDQERDGEEAIVVISEAAEEEKEGPP